MKHSFLAVLLFTTSYFYAQTEVEMQTQADKLFANEQYLEATSLYLRLLSLDPKSTNNNYRYGACLLYNSQRKSDALKYLRYASSDPAIPSDVYYFLGKAYHLNYQFGEAIKNYTTYNQNKTKATKKFDADREIQMCNNGKNLMSTLSDLIVTEKKEIQTDKFFRLYDLKNIGGSILVTAEFQTKLDKKYNHIPLIHFPQNPSVIYYSSYGETEGTGKDIYVRRRLPNGAWGEPQKLPGAVNTKYDEDFPYMHPDGKWLYFSSKGHNSMGGFDVFRSMNIPDENTFATPENMDFAISSPDDDMFYVVDSLNKNAYFGSARQSSDGKLYVYKVIVERVPIQLAVVKGSFSSDVSDQKKRCDIEIRDLATGTSIGKFNSNEKSTYLLTFPKGGKYEYIIKVEGVDKEFRANVAIPFMKEFRPLKQKIVHTMVDGNEVVKVIDLFNEEVDDPQAVLAEVIQMRSELNVNVQEFNMDELERNKLNQQILQDLGYGALSLVEVKDKITNDIQYQQTALNEAIQMQNNANAIVVQNSEQILAIEEAAKKKVADASKAETDEEKYKLLSEAAFLKEKIEEMKALNSALLASSDSIKTIMARSNTVGQITELNKLSEQYSKLLADGKKEEAVQLLVDNKTVLSSIKDDRSIHLKDNLVDRIVQLDVDQNKLQEKMLQYDKDVRTLETEIQNLQNERLNAKNKDLPAIDSKIASKTDEIAMIRAEREKLAKREEKIVEEKSHLAKQVDLIDIARNNKSSIDMTRDQANAAVLKTNSTNAKTLGNFIDQQIAELDKKDPTLRNRVEVNKNQPALANVKRFDTEGNGSSSNGSNSSNVAGNQGNNAGQNDAAKKEAERQRIAQLKLNFENEKKKIVSNNALSPTEKLNQQKALVERFSKTIEQENSNAEYPESIAELKTLQQTLDKEKSSVETEITAINYQVEPATNEAEKVAELKTSFLAEKAQLEKNTSLSKEQQIQEKKALNTKVLGAIEEQIKSSKDQELIAELNDWKADIEAENQQLDFAMEFDENLSDNSKALIASVDKNYNKKSDEIQKNTSLSTGEKNLKMQQIDKELMSSIKQKVAMLEEQIKLNPNDQQLKDEKNRLENLASIVESKIEERAQMQSVDLFAGLTEEQIEEKKNALLTTLDKTYPEENKRLEEQKDFDAIIVLNNELKIKVQAEKVKVDKVLKNSPSNKEALEQNALLEKITAAANEKINSAEAKKLENAPIQITSGDKEKMLAELDSPIKNLPLTAQDVKSMDDQQLDKIQDQLGDLQAAIIARSSTAAEELKDQPENKEIKKELMMLSELKSDVDQQQKVIEQELKNRDVAAESQIFTASELQSKLEQVVPSHSKDLTSIEAKTELGEKEKLQEENTVLHESLDKVLDEQLKIEQQLAENPNNRKLVTESKLLEAVATSLEKEIGVNEKAIEQLNEVAANNGNPENVILPTEASVKNALIPGFEDNKAAIRNDASLNEEMKKSLLVQANEAMIQKAENKLAELETALRKDPENKVLLAEKSIVEKLKGDAESEIQQLTTVSTTTIDSKELIKQISPDYFDQKEQLKQNPTSVDEVNKQLSLEEKLTTQLLAEQKKVEKDLKKNPNDETLKARATAIEKLISEQNKLITKLQEKKKQLENSNVVVDVVAEEKKFIQELRAELFGGNEELLSIVASTKEGLEQQKKSLESYENSLNSQLEEKQAELKKSPDSQQVKNEVNWIVEEKTVVEKQLRSVIIEIGELTPVANTDTQNENPEITALNQQEKKLVDDLDTPDLSASDRKKLEKELSAVRSKKLEVEQKQVAENVAKNQDIIESQAKVMTIDNSQVMSEIEQANKLIAQANATKNKEDQLALLTEAASHQEKAKEAISTEKFNQEIEKVEEKYGLENLTSKEDLERKKRSYTIEIGELTQRIKELDYEISQASKKELEALKKQKTEAVAKKKELETKVSEIEQAINASVTIATTIPSAAQETVLSFNEEREIASTENYNNYVGKANEALLQEEKVFQLEKKAEDLRTELKKMIGENVYTEPEKYSQAQIEAKANELKTTETALNEAKANLSKKQEEAKQYLPTNQEEAMKMMNLMKRGIAPINKVAIAAALVPMPANGLDIKAEGQNKYSETNKIPVDVNNPKGLVYRVQIGAFAKEIDQNQFKEFNPVSGEKLTNGITRYMAGYFNSNANVMDALGKVRDLGYADAFPVAYCDGKRINLAEARRLEASGECVAKGSNEMMIEIAASTAVKMGLEDTTKLKKVPEYTYNQAPGAAKAEAIELRKGLFFTVQIGVFNKPVSSATLFNLNPYMSLRLPNGQIRYSTGIFHSIDEARPRKAEAIEKGVKDAFITAYFNGERIPINDAIAMLTEKGTSILEPKEPIKKVEEVKLPELVVNTSENKNIPVEVAVEKPKMFYQIVSKKTFDEFPIEVLNRYNSHGSFYFDEKDRKVKSAIVESEEALPQIHYFKDDVERVVMLPSSKNLQESWIWFNFDKASLPGDVTDWLLRINHRKEYYQKEDVMEIRIYGVDEIQQQEMLAEAQKFGIEFQTNKLEEK